MLSRLDLLEEGQEEVLVEGTLEEVVEYLQEVYPVLFDWISVEENQQPEDISKSEMPNFNEITDLRELRYELEKVNLGFWRLEVKELDI